MDWMNLLKVKQILTPITDINIKKVPKKKKPDNCCDIAKNLWLEFAGRLPNFGNKNKYLEGHRKFVDMWHKGEGENECEEFIDKLVIIHLATRVASRPFGVNRTLFEPETSTDGPFKNTQGGQLISSLHPEVKFTPNHIRKAKDVLMAYAECRQKSETNFDWIDWARRL